MRYMHYVPNFGGGRYGHQVVSMVLDVAAGNAARKTQYSVDAARGLSRIIWVTLRVLGSTEDSGLCKHATSILNLVGGAKCCPAIIQHGACSLRIPRVYSFDRN